MSRKPKATSGNNQSLNMDVLLAKLRDPDARARLLPSEADLPVLPNPHLGRMLLPYVIQLLREGRPLGKGAARYLADALEAALKNPPGAAEALGIKRPKGRGTARSGAGHLELAMVVHMLRATGFAMTPSKRDQGILERVAKERHCSVDTVKRAWKEHRQFLEMQAALRASEASDEDGQ